VKLISKMTDTEPRLVEKYSLRLFRSKFCIGALSDGYSVHLVVGRPISVPSSSQTKRLKNSYSQLPWLDIQHKRNIVENKPASSLFVSPSKPLNEMLLSLSG